MKIDVAQLEFIHIKLRKIILWLEAETGLEFMGTSLFRIGDGGVHGDLPLRGFDLRMRNKIIGRAIEGEINSAWVYDPNRPKIQCALLHGNGSNMHLHIQVHGNTRHV